MDLKNMSFEELADALAAYPWFGAARKVFCEKLQTIGGEEIGSRQYSDAALYLADRSKIASILRQKNAYSDKDIAVIIKKYITVTRTEEKKTNFVNTSFRGVGDYFSQDQYAVVREKSDDAMRNFVFDENSETLMSSQDGSEFDFCTETLAQIYADQGYYQQAKDIYSKLILAYPEKNVYFAALIEKLNQEIKN